LVDLTDLPNVWTPYDIVWLVGTTGGVCAPFSPPQDHRTSGAKTKARKISDMSSLSSSGFSAGVNLKKPKAALVVERPKARKPSSET